MIPTIIVVKILTIMQPSKIPELETVLISAIRRSNAHEELPIMIFVIFALCYPPYYPSYK